MQNPVRSRLCQAARYFLKEVDFDIGGYSCFHFDDGIWVGHYVYLNVLLINQHSLACAPVLVLVFHSTHLLCSWAPSNSIETSPDAGREGVES